MRAWGSRYRASRLGALRPQQEEDLSSLDISYHTLQAYLTYQPLSSADEAKDGSADDGGGEAQDEESDALETAAPE